MRFGRDYDFGMRCAAAVIGAVVALAIAACADNEDSLRADWSQLAFPPDIHVTAPVEVAGGVTNSRELFAVAIGPRDVDARTLTQMLRSSLVADGWRVFGRDDIRPGFFAEAPGSDDVAEIAPLRELSHHVNGYRGSVREMIRGTQDRARSVLVHLGPVEQPAS